MLTFHINLHSVETKRWHARAGAFVVAVGFRLKKDGFAWEGPQKAKKTSSDMLGFEKCVVKTYIFRTWCPEG